MDTIKLILKGGLFGIANIIPGVSGGTMAVVLGIYEEMIEAIGNFFLNREKRRRYFLFLLKVGIGAAITILIFSWVMDYLLTYYEVYTYLFFIGLIIGSVPAIYKTHPDMKLNTASIITFLFGAGILIGLALAFPHVEKSVNLEQRIHFNLLLGGKLFISGFLSGGSMIVPGISGSFILVLLGQYHTVIRAVKHIDIIPLIFLGAGIALGIWSFAKIIDILLKKFPKETFYFILGLVIASVYPIFPGLPERLDHLLIAIFITLLAAFLSFQLDQSDKKNIAQPFE